MSLTYNQAVEQTITAGEQIHQIVNGTATTEVTVEDGSKVPSIRKALLDNFYFKDPIAWQVGQTENVFNQLRQFTDGSWWYAPSATASNPISMGSTPIGDSLWKIYDFDAIGKLTPRIDEALRRSYAEAGYKLVAGSFEAGGTLVNANDVLLQERTGKAFTGPAGTVAAGTNPASGGFVDRSDIFLRDSIGVYLEDFGAVGGASIDPVTGIVSGTDDTAAIKAAVHWMNGLNGLNTVSPENGGAYGFKLLGKPGAVYRVTGNNILGNQRAESGETTNLASSFYFDGSGCTFIWTPTSSDDSWVDYAATYYRPTIKNYRTLIAGSVNARAVLRSHSGPSGNVFQEGCFDDTVFIAGSNPSGTSWRAGGYMEVVFDLDGTILTAVCADGLNPSNSSGCFVRQHRRLLLG